MAPVEVAPASSAQKKGKKAMSSPKKVKTAAAVKKPRSEPLHPSYLQMTSEAILALKDRTGSSQFAIAKYIESKYKAVLPPNFKKILSVQLKNLVKQGKLVRVKASFKLSDDLKKQVAPKRSKAKSESEKPKKAKSSNKAKPAPKSQSTASKAPAKKSSVKKTPAKKAALKKPVAKKPAARKPVAMNPAAKRPAAKKPTAAKMAKLKSPAKPVAKKPAKTPRTKASPKAKKPSVKKAKKD